MNIKRLRKLKKKNWVLSEYNEDTNEQLDYYMNERKCAIGDKAYLYSHFEDKITEMEIVKIIARSDNIEYYDNLSKEALLDGEDEYNADTSAEFITDNDCYLVWFKYMMRLISLSDGTCMGDELIIFRTNAPKNELKNLQKTSCQIYLDGGNYEDVPIWADVLADKGYLFEYVDSHAHINPFATSNEWIKKKYPEIKEHYIIENQP